MIKTYGTLILLIASVVLNIEQARKLAEYKPGEPLPRAGTVLRALDAKTLDGREVHLTLAGQPTIIYYFSPRCGWCEKNWLNAKALQAATSGQYRFIAVSALSDVKSYALDHELTFDIYTDVSPDTATAFHFSGTPQTIVLSERGVVEATWAGAYLPETAKAIERRFGIVLPGLENKARVTQ